LQYPFFTVLSFYLLTRRNCAALVPAYILETDSVLIANVIFHAFEAAYVSWAFLFPLAIVVLAAEAAILGVFNRAKGGKASRFFAAALLMNVSSYVFGYWISPHLYVDSGLIVVDPDERGHGVLVPGPEWQRLSRYSFVQAGLLSIMIEAAALLPLRKWTGIQHVVVPVILGNCLSYLLLGLGFVWLFGG
jgi:hypothetical protein